MTLASGTRLGPYEVAGPLGAGGMGEVYRARDPRLGRDVAIKALPAAFAQDLERLARFEREAKLLASLSHPNIAGILGLEEADGARYLVLELVEGESLAARLTRGSLPLDEALDVARGVATGLEAAHESGIVHRDLKPGNVMLATGGAIKVLDFGLAKASSPERAGSDANLSASPTRTYAATGAGVILGTAAYMSPEQARGKAVDRRTDIWSFGCLLYECLTGRPLFAGETVSDLIAKILQTEPDWTALPAATPARLRELLARCLRKDPRQRQRDIGDVRLELEEIAAGRGALAAAKAGDSTGPWRALAIAALVVAAGLVTLLAVRRSERSAITRLSVLSPDPTVDIGDRGNYAISPDGRSIAFVLTDSAGTRRICVRDLDTPSPRALAGTEGARWPFWSADSHELGFFADGKLRRIPAKGGGYQNLADAKEPRGGAWGKAGVIVYAPEPRGPLYRVEATGGAPRVATVLDTTRRIMSHRFPRFLPDGRHFLYSIQALNDTLTELTYVASLDDPHGRSLGFAGDSPTFAPPDWVLFYRDRSLCAQRIDPRTLRTRGPTIPLAEPARGGGDFVGSPVASASDIGTLVYSTFTQQPTRLMWLDAEGHTAALEGSLPPGQVLVSLSPDGKKALFVGSSPTGASESESVLDLSTGRLVEFAPLGRGVVDPVWNPTGASIVGTRRGVQNAWTEIDVESGTESVVFAGDGIWRLASGWSGAARAIACSELTTGRSRDIRWLSLDGSRELHDYRLTPGDESDAIFSHDGRWLAYWSDAAGHADLYVDRFPTPEHPRRVSSGIEMGAMSIASPQLAWWAAGDGEILFLAGDGISLYACDVATTPTLHIGPPRLFARLPNETRGADFDPVHRRMLLQVLVSPRFSSLTVVQNWARQLEKSP